MYKYEMVKPGQQYAELRVIEEDIDKENEYYTTHPNRTHVKFFKCECSCGKLTTVNVYSLLNGKTRSCGHLQKSLSGASPKDLSGVKINELTVLRRDDSKPSCKGKHAYWLCECEICGRISSHRSAEIISGKLQGCGCQAWKRRSDKKTRDLTGMDFGHLHVIDRDYSTVKNNGGDNHARWFCECDLCGCIESVSSDSLIHYGKDRCRLCGGVSLGEQKIIEILQVNNIPFVYDKTYSNCKRPETGGSPRFDFRITQHSDCDYVIEFDGEQHFKSVYPYDSTEPFAERVARDDFKNQWCHEHCIPIIRIPYTRLNKLNISDLQLETTEYLIDPKSPQGDIFIQSA